MTMTDNPLTLLADSIPEKATETPISAQKWNKANHVRSLKRSVAKVYTPLRARAVLFDMKRKSLGSENTYVSIVIDNNTTPFPTTDLNEFIHYYFNQKDLLEFSRLHSLSKLMLAQFVLNNQEPETRPISIPFVYRYSLDQQKLTQRDINKKINRILTKALNRKPLFWLAPEYDDEETQVLTHTNGEILIYPNEFIKLAKAFIQIHGKNNAGAKKNSTLQGNKIIRLLTPSRNRWAVKRSLFYSIYNWASYATKQQNQKKLLCRIANPRKQYVEKDNLVYISAELKRLSTNFYNKNIRNK
jgi:hypothetical protein